MRRLLPLAIAAASLLCLVPATAGAAKKPKLPKDVQRITYRYPIDLKPGTNIIKIRFNVPKPTGPGYMVRFAPNLTRRDGSIPPTDKIHLHHGVFLKFGGGISATPGYPAEIISATGEEKTIVTLPRPYGYPINGGDTWILNDMIHDLTNRGMKLFMTWTVDYVPANSALGRTLKPVHTAWMDVEQGKTYPVFDVLKGSGTNGKFTYPDQAPNAYAGRSEPANETKITRPGTLVSCFGHVHPGGLYTDLRLTRDGRSKLLFRADAHYFGKRPPVSWDLAMTATKKNWRVRVQPGDVLSVHATYDTKHGSWYESMGIMPCSISYDDTSGADPFASKIQARGSVTHGHLKENDHWGGGKIGIVDPATLPDGSAPGNAVDIGNFKYRYGDLRGAGAARNPPTVPVGQSLKFINQDATPGKDYDLQIYHTVTACKAPCNLSTGMGYPLPNGSPVFDSGQLGFGQVGFTASANRNTWETPTNLSPGTYTYLCRGHPFMRGAFRVVAVKS